MNVKGESYKTIWLNEANPKEVKIINQLKLPFSFEINTLRSCEDACLAISEMQVRGAGLIGATAGFGMYLATLECSNNNFEDELENFARKLISTRPTASNLFWAVNKQKNAISKASTPEEKRMTAKEEAIRIADEDAAFCKKIGEHGFQLIADISNSKNGKTVNILTHCNAGWLAFVDHGSATSPIYAAHDAGVDVHVWVDETRPRNQGASLTCWELAQHGVKHTLVVDNLGGHLMQHGMVDMVLVGTDRTTRTGDVANKIGTYLKALAANDNDVPFYVALPSSTFDFEVSNGLSEIPIEERSEDEVLFPSGLSQKRQEFETLQISPTKTRAKNWGFDVTPAKLISGLICERGICEANEKSILSLFPEKA
ncbi:MAG: S-methyl-5-thioribose-1-phosphate isomerase [Opitutae bacterium]|jgi:methylthioribose-1-phosphate isomerase|nr:S-methyl-5-thioribose-1-phosphate isomerase [Opitutae bacterium]